MSKAVEPTTVAERVDLIRSAHRLTGGRCARCQSVSCDANFLLDVLGDIAAVAADALTDPDPPDPDGVIAGLRADLAEAEDEIDDLTAEVARWKALSRKNENALRQQMAGAR